MHEEIILPVGVNDNKNKINEAYEMLREGMPPGVVAQTLDIPLRDIEHMGDSRCV